MLAKFPADFLGFIFSEQTIIDEDARQLRADGFEQQSRRDRRIHAAGESANHPAVSHALADEFDLAGDQRTNSPSGFATADVRDEVGEYPPAVFGVRDFGMKLQAVNRLVFVLHRRERAGVGLGQGHEILAEIFDLIAVAHPHGQIQRDALEQQIGIVAAQRSSAELAGKPRRNFAAPRQTRELHAVADPQDGHAQIENRGVGVR